MQLQVGSLGLNQYVRAGSQQTQDKKLHFDWTHWLEDMQDQAQHSGQRSNCPKFSRCMYVIDYMFPAQNHLSVLCFWLNCEHYCELIRLFFIVPHIWAFFCLFFRLDTKCLFPLSIKLSLFFLLSFPLFLPSLPVSLPPSLPPCPRQCVQFHRAIEGDRDRERGRGREGQREDTSQYCLGLHNSRGRARDGGTKIKRETHESAHREFHKQVMEK